MSAAARLGFAPKHKQADLLQGTLDSPTHQSNAPPAAGGSAYQPASERQPAPAGLDSALEAAVAEASLAAAVLAVQSEERSANQAAQSGGGRSGSAASPRPHDAAASHGKEEGRAGEASAEARSLGGAPPEASAPTEGPESALAGLVARTPSCVLRPRAFFVSWQGVLTLAFRRAPSPGPPAPASLSGTKLRAVIQLATGVAGWKT